MSLYSRYFIIYRCLLEAYLWSNQMVHAWNMKQNGEEPSPKQLWGLTETHKTLGSWVQPISLLSASEGGQTTSAWHFGSEASCFSASTPVSARAVIPSLSRPVYSQEKKDSVQRSSWGLFIHPPRVADHSQHWVMLVHRLGSLFQMKTFFADLLVEGAYTVLVLIYSLSSMPSTWGQSWEEWEDRTCESGSRIQTSAAPGPQHPSAYLGAVSLLFVHKWDWSQHLLKRALVRMIMQWPQTEVHLANAERLGGVFTCAGISLRTLKKKTSDLSISWTRHPPFI